MTRLHERQRLLREFREARARLDRLTEGLDVLADWRGDLERRLAREQLKIAAAVGTVETHEALAEEIAEFRAACEAFALELRVEPEQDGGRRITHEGDRNGRS